MAEDKKSARRRGAWIIFQDESGFSLLPPVRATWAPKGQTPVLRHRFSWTRLSMARALAYRPDRSETALLFQIKEGAYNTESLIEFLTDLREQFDGAKVTLIWDGPSAHKSKRMKAWLAEPEQRRCWSPRCCPATPTTSTRSRWSGGTSNRSTSPTSARTPSTRRTPPPKRA